MLFYKEKLPIYNKGYDKLQIYLHITFFSLFKTYLVFFISLFIPFLKL